jgi:Fe2+ or Zn2+ uptake regulation protein
MHPNDVIHATVEARLKLIDQRYTSARRELIGLLATSANPVAMTDIAAALPHVARSTAYRTLDALAHAGLVRRVAANDEFARYELAEELTEHHHHMLCVRCGDVIDVVAPTSFEDQLHRTVSALALEHGFRVADHRLDILGHCASCEGRR